MDLERRDAMKGLGALGAFAMTGTGTAVALDEHEDEEEEPAPQPLGENEAGVRVAHLSPDAPNVDVYVEGDPVLEDVGYGDVSDYLIVEAGTYQVTVTAAGDPDTVAFEGDVAFGRTYYTVAAIGELGAETFMPLVLKDYNVAQVRLIHASPDAPAVDVTIQDEQRTWFEDVTFGGSTDYVAVPPGSYTLEVRPAALYETGNGDAETEAEHEDEEDDEAEDDDVVATFDVEVAGGDAYSAWAIGYLDPEAAGEDRPFDLAVTLDGVSTVDDPEPEPDEDDEET